MKHRIVVAVTGASGSIYAKQVLEKLVQLQDQIEQVAIVLSTNARTVWETELGNKDYEQLPFPVYAQQDFHAPFASGSGLYNTMIICPCSMGTLGRIAQGISNDLVTRAADVVLKERRKLICVVRETPYNLIHLRNMQTLTEAGGIVCPATPSFYSRPQTLEEVAATVTDRIIDLAGLQQKTYRWGSES
ncbi:4-hydroxy-3-polyprenylbenzoate decarboxylase [Chitinophaga skermanii]|uniref:Flavin prenyltransferase UbiX n=1 Tax=Chitinophaga skermanii TaxID=331697 RepID=A0A327QN40_9BACT|nr:UbiX family flavin prenyltransferase [Chitinophaga skermanii]RAJ05114.1 4-hydroxy-3-polyprenylbenzoate decarboxylase [Chitinophaga skermanii]